MKKAKSKLYQRVLALALALTLCLGMTPLAALAEDGVIYELSSYIE